MLHTGVLQDDWVEVPAGWLGRRELKELADRLLSTPIGLPRRLILDWTRVRHCDFRGLPPLGAALARLRDSGVTVIGFGMSDYLLAIALVGLSTDEAEIFADFAEETGRSFARVEFGSPGERSESPSWNILEN